MEIPECTFSDHFHSEVGNAGSLVDSGLSSHLEGFWFRTCFWCHLVEAAIEVGTGRFSVKENDQRREKYLAS